MALYQLRIGVSDVDRGFYDELRVRASRHPSESDRYFSTRVLAYCLSYEPGIAFSGGGVSAGDVPPLAVRDPADGRLRVWIDVGTPSAARLHKAAKAAERVVLYAHAEPVLLRREAAAGAIHRAAEIEVWRIDPDLLAALASRLERQLGLELVRSDGRLYLTLGGEQLDGAIERSNLLQASER